MNDLATISPKVSVTPLGLEVSEELTFEEWSSLAPHLGDASRSIGFVIGDWLVYGDRFAVQQPLPGFKDRKPRIDSKRYEIALTKTGLDRLTLRNHAYVAKSVPRSCRNDVLSFEHHRALAKLELEAQREWITTALTEIKAGRHMSVRRLRRSIEAGRVLAVEELQGEATDTGLSNHIPFVNRLVGWWAKMRDGGWLKTASVEKRAALKRDLQPIVQIYEQL